MRSQIENDLAPLLMIFAAESKKLDEFLNAEVEKDNYLVDCTRAGKFTVSLSDPSLHKTTSDSLKNANFENFGRAPKAEKLFSSS